jgi:hypothetical protein
LNIGQWRLLARAALTDELRQSHVNTASDEWHNACDSFFAAASHKAAPDTPMQESEHRRSSFLASLAIVTVLVMLCLSASAIKLNPAPRHIGQRVLSTAETNIRP